MQPSLSAHRHFVRAQSVPASPATGWDRLGMWLSYGCALHCALTPLLAGYLAVDGLGWLGDKSFEWSLIAATLSIGLFRLLYSYLKEHRRPEPVAFYVMGVGLVLAAKSIFFQTPSSVEPFAMAAGGLLIGTAHFRNRSFSHCRSV